MPGISYSNSKSKMPKSLRLASYISTFLFEEQYGECSYLNDSTIKNLERVRNALLRAASKNVKK